MYSRSMWFDIDHATERLGWRPQWSNDEMFAQSYDWFVANRALATSGASGVSPPAHRSSRLLSVLKRAATRPRVS